MAPKHLHPKNVPHDVNAPILKLAEVCLNYDANAALEGLSFQLKTGERVAVVGPNGAGKSTLFQVIAGILAPSRGDIHIYGHRPGRHLCIAYVPQRTQVDWTFPVNVTDVVMMGRVGKLGLLRYPGRVDWDFVRSCLEALSIADLAKRQIAQLSGGQQQRMMIARALAQEAELMLMDEPLTGLDVRSQGDILDVMDVLRGRGVTVMVATHDLDLAARRFDRVMLLNRRVFGFGPPEEVFTQARLAAAYGGSLERLGRQDDKERS
ncbi:MAG TPA: metal ABC transporter ATP-binding protein [Candidatus Bipolaricaulota bacterium]